MTGHELLMDSSPENIAALLRATAPTVADRVGELESDILIVAAELIQSQASEIEKLRAPA